MYDDGIYLVGSGECKRYGVYNGKYIYVGVGDFVDIIHYNDQMYRIKVYRCGVLIFSGRAYKSFFRSIELMESTRLNFDRLNLRDDKIVKEEKVCSYWENRWWK